LLVSCICCLSEDAAREIQDYAAHHRRFHLHSQQPECWLMTLVNKIPANQTTKANTKLSRLRLGYVCPTIPQYIGAYA